MESDVKQDLANLKPRKISGRVKELMPVIEERLAAGVAMDDIVGVLNKSGITINKATLTVYLSRFRKPKSGKVTFTAKPVEAIKAPSLKPEPTAEETPTTFPDMSPERMARYEELGRQRYEKSRS